VIREAGVVQLVDVPRPEPRGDDVLVQVLLAGICRTDLQVAAGTLAAAEPITLGHELAGRLETGELVAIDPRVRDGFLGVDRHGAFAEYVVVPAANIYRLPNVDPRAAAYVEPIAAALSAPELVVGARRGIVGGATRFSRLVGDLLRLDGFEVGTFEPNAFDFAVETSGTADELAMLVDALRPTGVLVLKSRRPGTIEMPHDRIAAKGLTVRAKHYGAFDRAVDLVATGALDLAPLFGATFPLADFREAFARAAADETRKLFLSCAD
jgi:threonine dehydrogenase-like Zn-dependent dehydrogenase